jgi:hypothetical protein
MTKTQLRSNLEVNGVKTLRFRSISCCLRPQQAPESDDHVLVVFWNESLSVPVASVNVCCPRGWTPRIYLAALSFTISKRNLVLMAPDTTIMGSGQLTLNEVHWLFVRQVADVSLMLDKQHAFCFINGGGL